MFTIGMIVGILFSITIYIIIEIYPQISEWESEQLIDPVSVLEGECKRPRVVGTLGDCPDEMFIKDMEVRNEKHA